MYIVQVQYNKPYLEPGTPLAWLFILFSKHKHDFLLTERYIQSANTPSVFIHIFYSAVLSNFNVTN